MARVFLIRHVEVDVREGVPPAEWLPTAAGLEAAERLAAEPFVRGLTLVATSPEPKALTTAEPVAAAAGAPLRVDPGLREVGRRAQPVTERSECAALVGHYLAGGPIDGWEAADEARARFAGALARVAAEADGPLAVVTHGLVISLRLGYGVEEWRALELPDVVEIDV